MVRTKGKASASTKRSGSDDVASEASLTKDSTEMENNVEIGGFVQTAVTEQTTITVVAEHENNGAKAETLEEENDGSEADTFEEENDGLKPETIEGERAMNEDRDYKENEVVGGGETCTADKKAEDTIGNDQGTNEETTIEQECGKENVDDKQVEGAVGINIDNQEDGMDKDNQEDSMEKNEGETNAKNKEEVEGSLKTKTKRLEMRNNRKRKANGPPQEKGKNKQVHKKVASIGKVGEDSGKLDSTERSSKKVASKDKSGVAPKDIDLEGKDKTESSRKKSSAKNKVDSMGMIFMCNSETKKDCYRYKVLGLPAHKKEMVEKIYKGMRLFLYDIDSKLMYGIYKAAGHGGCNIQPNAFKSQFPSQVRFTVHNECLPLAEETFRQAIKENYYTRRKFHCELSSKQVKDLCKLFSIAVKPWIPPLQPLPPPSTVESYSRTLGRDPYGRDIVIQHNESYRQSRLVDAYRRDRVIGAEPRDYYRWEGCEYHQPPNLETRLQVAGGVNVPHRERLPYHDPINSVRSQPEYNPPPEYLRGSARGVRPEHPSSAAGPLFGLPHEIRFW